MATSLQRLISISLVMTGCPNEPREADELESTIHVCTTQEDASVPRGGCALLSRAAWEVRDMQSGVALDLHALTSQAETATLRDYVGHLAQAWNEAEHGIVEACDPHWSDDASSPRLPSTVELSPLSDGVRVLFSPLDLRATNRLREHVHARGIYALACACDR